MRNLLITSILLVIFCGSAFSQVEITWYPNSEADLAGYKIYYGLSPRNYTHIVDVGNLVSGTISGLQAGTLYYFAVTAYDTAGNESGYSDEVAASFEHKDTTPPSIPVQVVIKGTIDIIVTIHRQDSTGAEK